MPELPEVETIRLDLEKAILKKEISQVKVLNDKTIKNELKFFKKSLSSFKFEEISRRGKLLFLKISGADNFLLIHLKMTGQLIYLKNDQKLAGGHSLNSSPSSSQESSFLDSIGGELPNKYTRVIFYFKDGGTLFFNDLRKFGYLKISSEEELKETLLKNYGPEPLEKELDAKYLLKILNSRTRPIKTLLLDQKIVAGLGNIYVDEALFLAGILPDRLAKTLKEIEIKKLLNGINKVIKLALKSRGTTFSNFRDGTGKKGNFSRFLNVYGRDKELCLSCKRPIKKIKLNGRGTHFCPNCQK